MRLISNYRKGELVFRRIAKRRLNEITTKSERYRAAKIIRLDECCNCGLHRAVRLLDTNDNVVVDIVCPLMWWVVCLNPGTFDNDRERSEWLSKHPAPENDWDNYIENMVRSV